MKETFLNFISQPIVIGLLMGLVVALLVWVRGTMKRAALSVQASEKQRTLRTEIDTLQKHLHTQMQISAKGNEATLSEVEELKRQNDNLKGVLAALKSKPGRAELRTLHLYEKAIRLMNSRAPGFAPVWESVMADAEAEIKKEESGLLSWIRKPFLLHHREDSESKQSSQASLMD